MRKPHRLWRLIPARTQSAWNRFSIQVRADVEFMCLISISSISPQAQNVIGKRGLGALSVIHKHVPFLAARKREWPKLLTI